jgi:hypothetical protein
MSDRPEKNELVLPPEPERPDCCNGGCAVCVLDGFEDEVEAWRQLCDRLRAEHAARQNTP